MNINFKINKEEENVIVSNEKGTIETREYQDNIKDILVLEDVVEGLEHDLDGIEKERIKNEQKIKDIDFEIQEKKTWRFFKKALLEILIGLPPFFCFVSIFSKWIIEEPIQISLSFFSEALLVGGILDVIVIIYSLFIICSRNFSLMRTKQLNEDRESTERIVKRLDLEISCLEQILTKNKEELHHLLEQKEQNNIQNMSNEILKVSYQDALEIQRTLLSQMQYQRSCEEKQKQETTQSKDMTLRRFKRLKDRN